MTFGVKGQRLGVKLGQMSISAFFATSQTWFHLKITVTPTVTWKCGRKIYWVYTFIWHIYYVEVSMVTKARLNINNSFDTTPFYLFFFSHVGLHSSGWHWNHSATNQIVIFGNFYTFQHFVKTKTSKLYESEYLYISIYST